MSVIPLRHAQPTVRYFKQVDNGVSVALEISNLEKGVGEVLLLLREGDADLD